MHEWRGARVVGEARGWLVLLVEVRQLGNGSWNYVYSIRPGVRVTITAVPHARMLPPYDRSYADLAIAAGAGYRSGTR